MTDKKREARYERIPERPATRRSFSFLWDSGGDGDGDGGGDDDDSRKLEQRSDGLTRVSNDNVFEQVRVRHDTIAKKRSNQNKERKEAIIARDENNNNNDQERRRKDDVLCLVFFLFAMMLPFFLFVVVVRNFCCSSSSCSTFCANFLLGSYFFRKSETGRKSCRASLRAKVEANFGKNTCHVV